jgi:hypothetical protein
MAYDTKQSIPKEFHDLSEEGIGGMLLDEASSEGSESKVHYPEMHFHGPHAEKLKKHLKKHGTATIHYKKISEGHRIEGGKDHHSVGIQIHGINPSNSEESIEPKEDGEDVIEKGLKAAESNQ